MQDKADDWQWLLEEEESPELNWHFIVYVYNSELVNNKEIDWGLSHSS